VSDSSVAMTCDVQAQRNVTERRKRQEGSPAGEGGVVREYGQLRKNSGAPSPLWFAIAPLVQVPTVLAALLWTHIWVPWSRGFHFRVASLDALITGLNFSLVSRTDRPQDSTDMVADSPMPEGRK